MHYDFAITCRESLSRGESDIGSCTRRLLLALAAAGRRCVAFVGTVPEADFTAACPHPVVFVPVTPAPTPPFENVRCPALDYAHAVSMAITGFLASHTIALIEFPDCRAEGWFFLHSNLVNRWIPSVAVRLHGPMFLRDTDNGVPACTIPQALVYAAEREQLARADHILAGGDALLARVLATFDPGTATALGGRVVKLPQPLPEPQPAVRPQTPPPAPADVARKLACVGSFSYRKGTDWLVLNAIRHFERHPESRLQIHLQGADTVSADGQSFLAFLEQLIPPRWQSRFVLPPRPAVLSLSARTSPASAPASTMDAFVFPARFDHLPAALLELVTLGKPTYVSTRGDMPALARSCPWLKPFDPAAEADWIALFAELDQPSPENASSPAVGIPPAPPPGRALPDTYAALAAPVIIPVPPVALALVIAHLDDLANLTALLKKLHAGPGSERLEIIVVDDGSPPDALAQLDRLCATLPRTRLLRTPRPRSGPFEARQIGAHAAAADYIGFVDADDFIEPERYLLYTQTLAENAGLDVFIPAMRFFGGETHAWLPRPKSIGALPYCGYAQVGMVGRKACVLRAFAHAAASVNHLTRAEDWFYAASLLSIGARIATIPECAYHYNRANPNSRSRNGDFMRWHTTADRIAHFERCLAEGLARGEIPHYEIQLMRRLSLTQPLSGIKRPSTRGLKAAWHTHLYRALRSALGDTRYSP